MKLLIIFTLGIVAAVAADQCNSVKCDVRKNCRCSNAVNPLGKDLKEYPQVFRLIFMKKRIIVLCYGFKVKEALFLNSPIL